MKILCSAGCLQLLEFLELLEIYWNLKTLLKILEISWKLIVPPGNCCVRCRRSTALVSIIKLVALCYGLVFYKMHIMQKFDMHFIQVLIVLCLVIDSVHYIGG